MIHFIKLNLVSIIYAFIALIPIQLIGNVYRINRLTGWKIATINTITAVVIIIEFIVGTILILTSFFIVIGINHLLLNQINLLNSFLHHQS
ncbi:hypothetical protein SAMN05421807_10521 [Virgibacillus chiguensis]|uniref:Uncharacterized protein n=1 Tax=Virgibacillus chiguensis TaxID=411959 RepID=A0A1M5R5E0_9BACI|nr:hypothetical protein SAMN05421807_10521 [Virgibacillus chiguensis]